MDQNLEKLAANLKRSLADTFESIQLADLPVESIAEQLAREVVNAARVDSNGRRFSPDQFTLSVHSSVVQGLPKRSEDFQAKLAFDIENAVRNAHFQLALKPHITFATDPTLGMQDTRVIAWHSTNPLGMQDSFEIADHDTDRPPQGAFLIIDGKRHYQLKSGRITIGRRLDNDLVLDDPHVSRLHAHLVARHGHFLLEDLDSTSGTRVNDRRVMEHYLEPGDIITIATSELIYGEDRTGPPESTPPYTPISQPERDRDLDTPLSLKVIDRPTRKLDR